MLTAGIIYRGSNGDGVDVDAGIGLDSAGDGETGGVGVADALASFALTSSSSFFSST